MIRARVVVALDALAAIDMKKAKPLGPVNHAAGDPITQVFRSMTAGR